MISTVKSTKHWSISIAAQGLAVQRIELALAADRPDRVEIEFGLLAGDDAARATFENASPGRPVRLDCEGRSLFAGLVSSRSVEQVRGVRLARVVAYATYESRRLQLEPTTYFELSDGEIAARIATELGLEPRVDSTSKIHDRITRDGDPLRFLRSRARETGYELAVEQGRLWFVRETPAIESISRTRPTALIGPGPSLHSAWLEERHARGRGGAVEIDGDESLLPLSCVEIRGLVPSLDGEYRAVRCVHTRDSAGYRTRLSLLEEGLDFERWEGESRESEG